MGDYIDRGPNTRSTLDILIEQKPARKCGFPQGKSRGISGKGFRRPILVRRLASRRRRPDTHVLWACAAGSDARRSCVDTARSDPRNAWRASGIPGRSAPQLYLWRLLLRPRRRSPGCTLADQRENDLLWIREEFLRSEEQFGKYIVHGHTPVRTAEILANRVNIDTGAYATGNLTLMSIQGSTHARGLNSKHMFADWHADRSLKGSS